MAPMSRRALLAATALPMPALAQPGFPNRPIRMVVPFAPGGTSDLAMRALCEPASRVFGQPVVVENRPGASGSLGPVLMRDARPDGYTLTMLAVPALRQVLLMPRPSFDPIADSTRIIHVGGYLLGVVVRPDSPWRSWQDFIAHARAHPGRLNYGTSGVTSTGNAAMTRIAELLGLDWVHVPFRGGAESTQALLAGQIDAAADSSSWAQMVQQGALRLLVTWGPERSATFPDVPTLRETGTDFTATSPYGIIGPRGMDPEIVRTLHDGFRTAMRDPVHVQTMARLDMPIIYMDTAAYEAAHLRQVEEERGFIRRLGLRLE